MVGKLLIPKWQVEEFSSNDLSASGSPAHSESPSFKTQNGGLGFIDPSVCSDQLGMDFLHNLIGQLPGQSDFQPLHTSGFDSFVGKTENEVIILWYLPVRIALRY